MSWALQHLITTQSLDHSSELSPISVEVTPRSRLQAWALFKWCVTSSPLHLSLLPLPFSSAPPFAKETQWALQRIVIWMSRYRFHITSPLVVLFVSGSQTHTFTPPSLPLHVPVTSLGIVCAHLPQWKSPPISEQFGSSVANSSSIIVPGSTFLLHAMPFGTCWLLSQS